jgi:hypothetical protein
MGRREEGREGRKEGREKGGRDGRRKEGGREGRREGAGEERMRVGEGGRRERGREGEGGRVFPHPKEFLLQCSFCYHLCLDYPLPFLSKTLLRELCAP